ncbi:hypothetical protein [Bradyrhizobium sp. WYCCWR 12699]|nr:MULTISPECIES: hypothetical protein [Bradyrhizobium]MDT4739142.1 hypothetical protein [Bradyrhizobium sp. WYCCWR 12699]
MEYPVSDEGGILTTLRRSSKARAALLPCRPGGQKNAAPVRRGD